ncbi:MAG: hypothetical protein ACK52C_04225 [Planctomycetia bacterium]
MSLQGSQRRDQRRRLLVSWNRSQTAARPVEPPVRRSMAEYAAEALPERQPAIATFLPTGIGGLAAAATLIIVALVGAIVLGGYDPVLASVGRLAGGRFAQTIRALGACVDPRSAMSLAGWLSQVLLAIAAAVAIVVRGMRRHRRDDYRGRYRAWGWLAGLLIGATCAAQFPLGRLVGIFVTEATGIELGPQGFGWWVVVATLLLGAVSAWAVLPLHERLATSAWLSAALAFWAASAACTWLGAGRNAFAIAAQASWMLGSGLVTIAVLAAARSVIREVRGESARQAQPRKPAESVAHTPRAAAVQSTQPGSWSESGSNDGEPADAEDESGYTGDFTDGSDEDRPSRHLSKAERKRLKKLARMNRVA